MTKTPQIDDFSGSGTYEIRINGHLDRRWEKAYEHMRFIQDDDGTTLITGKLPDQTALHSILLKIRNMNLMLISVSKV